MVDFLSEEGFTVFGASDGEAGLRIAEKEKPDLILLDIILPRKNGFEVLSELRQIEELKKTPVILLTNLDGSENVQKAFELGVSTYLVKANYRLEDIAKKVREALSA
jgi:two-component system alkaline phosphatase synthesis response regulator PhoP